MSWLKSLLRVGSRARLVGTDLSGNQYFEKITRAGQRPRRSVKLKEAKKEDQYTMESIPLDWDRWLRGLRNEPPLHEELIARTRQSEILRQKVTDAMKKDVKHLTEKDTEGQGAGGPSRVQAVDHASAPSFKSEANSTKEPTSTGKTFQPGSWTPGQ